MGKKYRLHVDLRYPSPKTLPIVLKAGGMSKLSDAERDKVEIVRAKHGTMRSDLHDCGSAHAVPDPKKPDKKRPDTSCCSVAGLLWSGRISEVKSKAKDD